MRELSKAEVSMKSQAIKYSRTDKIYFIVSGVVLTLILLLVLYPLIFVLSASFSSGSAVTSGRVVLWPVDFSLDGYAAVFERSDILGAYGNTIMYTVLGTIINVSMALLTAYPLSRPDFKGRNQIMLLFTFTMFFSGGMIPTYILIKDLKMIDTIWAMIIPGAVNVYNVIITRTFIQSSIPKELYEASSIDGCNDARYFFSMVLPLSSSVIAVIALFSAVTHWNAYFSAMMYLNTRTLLPLQMILREILVMNQVDLSQVADPEAALKLMGLGDVLKYALIVVATAPILCIYPFAQKYFVKGVMVGSVKG